MVFLENIGGGAWFLPRPYRKPAATTWATLSDSQQGFFYMHHPTDRITHTSPIPEWQGSQTAHQRGWLEHWVIALPRCFCNGSLNWSHILCRNLEAYVMEIVPLSKQIHPNFLLLLCLPRRLWPGTFWVTTRKEGNALFNDTLNTFYIRLYGVGHMVKDQSDSESGNPLPPHGLLFPIRSKGSFICIIRQTA